MNAFKQQCVDLRKRDHTLPEIVRITGRPKTSVFFHIRNIPLSARKRSLIRETARSSALKLSEQRKGRSTRSFRKFSGWNKRTVSLVAHLLFDGEIRYTECAYSNRNIALIKKVEKLMTDMYDFEPSRSQNKVTGVFRISYFNVELSAYIRMKADALLGRVVRFPRELKAGFLRAFFDDEGCMDYKPAQNTRRIRGYQKDVAVLALIQELLGDLGIASCIRKPNEVVISGKENLIKFQKEVNFSPGVCINGKRSNSVWKRQPEKREILRHAIGSFR